MGKGRLKKLVREFERNDSGLLAGTRGEIYTLIEENPGITMSGICNKLEISGNNTRYHLRILHNPGQIKMVYRKGHYEFYPYNSDVPKTETIEDIVKEEKGISVKKISDRMDVTSQTIYRRISENPKIGLENGVVRALASGS